MRLIHGYIRKQKSTSLFFARQSAQCGTDHVSWNSVLSYDKAAIIQVSRELSLFFTSSFTSLTSSLYFPQSQSIQSTVFQSFTSLSTIPHHSQIPYCFLFNFIIIYMVLLNNFIFTHVIFQSFYFFLSIILALVHIDYIQIIHAPLFPLVHNHTDHYLLLTDIILLPSALL